MQKISILIIVALCCLKDTYANIFRVNNTLTTNPVQKTYNSILEANNSSAVLPGDTLMIEGCPTEYDGTALNKRLVLIGPGYLLNENPQTQANLSTAVLRNLTFENGASGSIIAGLTFSGFSGSYIPYISNASNIVIMRCYLPNPIVLIGNVSGIQIIQNYFARSAIYIGSGSYTFTGVSLKNNYIDEAQSITSSDSYQRIFSAVENNIFNGNVTLTANVFRSNIITSTTAVVAVSSGSIENNLVANSQLPATNGNQTFNAANLFVGVSGNSIDGQYKLKGNSPYLAAGYNNTQPGIFGGTSPYVLSGLPATPAIYGFTADGFVNKAAGLQVNIKVKANQ